MARHWSIAFAAVLLIMSLTPTVATMDDPESQVIGMVNQARAQHGLGPLSLSFELTASARNYASAMAHQGFFGHIGPNGSSLDTRDEAAGYSNWTFLAENLAAGQSSSKQAVDAWIASPSHLADLLSPLARETGVGLVVSAGSKYTFYWVQEFGDRAARTVKAAVIPPPAPRPAATATTVPQQPSASVAKMPTIVPQPTSVPIIKIATNLAQQPLAPSYKVAMIVPQQVPSLVTSHLWPSRLDDLVDSNQSTR